jgi:hypothetical protein
MVREPIPEWLQYKFPLGRRDGWVRSLLVVSRWCQPGASGNVQTHRVNPSGTRTQGKEAFVWRRLDWARSCNVLIQSLHVPAVWLWANGSTFLSPRGLSCTNGQGHFENDIRNHKWNGPQCRYVKTQILWNVSKSQIFPSEYTKKTRRDNENINDCIMSES